MRPHLRTLLISLLAAAPLLAQGGGGVQFRDWKVPTGTAKPKTACSELSSLTGYEFSVYSTALIPASATVPEHCRVSLMVQPEINVEVNLPTAWNGRLYMFGNGGFAGEPFDSPGRIGNRSRGLKAGFVTAATDTGHSAAAEPGGSFALNRQKAIDFGFRSLHVTADSAKRVIKAYYTNPLSKSYFDGCSTGGRQALILAQRFPNDFDGIIAGSPGLFYSGTQISRAYWMQVLAQNPFPASKLPLLAKKVYDHCDAKDGLKDGLIDDPRKCDFRPDRDLPRCAGSDRADCFTSNQILALERIYSDMPRQGKRYFPGWPVGAEAIGPNGQSGWIGQEIDGATGPGAWTSDARNFIRFFAAPGTPLAGVSEADAISRFDVDKETANTVFARQILDATDPDLTAFKRRGGKLLMYFGWADPQLNARVGVEYYEDVVSKMGTTTPEFARMFLVPGMFHCGGGIGTGTFDTATPIVQWVEQGKAPDVIQAARIVNNETVRTRPLCPYPQVARYKGTGSIDDAANFACVKP